MKSSLCCLAIAAMAGLTRAEADYDLQSAVQMNLKWIRPPKWDEMPEDMETFFKQDPKDVKNFSTTSDEFKHIPVEHEAHHNEGAK